MKIEPAFLYFGFMFAILVLIIGTAIAYPPPVDPLTAQYTAYGF